jgi:hypothetical protein
MAINRKRVIAAGGGTLGLAIVAVLAFGVFEIHTAFIDDKVAEDGPVFSSGATAATDPPPTTTVDTTRAPSVETAVDISVDASGATTVEPTLDTTADTTVVTTAPAIVTVASGQFVERSHPGSGTARVLSDGSSQRFLRFEDFSTDNGPDLFVYLTTASADADADAFGVDGQYVNLGRLKGNVGAQNYEIPAEVDLNLFATVVIWCDRFSVAFTAADLTQR